jgi:hypothetical protein
MTKLRGQVRAATITSGVTVAPIDTPTTMKQTLRTCAGTARFNPASPAMVIAIAGPMR